MTEVTRTLSALTLTETPLIATVSLNIAWVVLGACLTLLATGGVWLIYGAGHGTQQRFGTLVMCIMAAGVAFFATGFAFAMGGVSGMYRGLGPLTGLGSQWLPYGEGRGILGTTGFFLAGTAYDSGVYALFLFQAALLILSASIALLPWAERAPRLAVLAFAVLFGGLLYPAFAHWAWGGGWLAHLGQVSGHGHGFVDFAGSGVVNAVGGLTALGACLALRSRSGDDAEHSDSLLLGGFALSTVGWIGLTIASTHAVTDARLAIAAANVVVALACAGAAGLLYTWFAAGEPDLRVGVQASLAGLVAIAAAAAFVPAWAAAVIGGVAGLVAPLAGYILGGLLRSTSGGAIAAVHGLCGLWGIAAVGLMADGTYGVGWNGIGEREYLGTPGLGVTGMFPGTMAPADPAQLTAQVAGILVLLLFPVVAWLFVSLARSLAVGGRS